MAKAALSGLLSQVRGRVGADVLVLTRTGLAVRRRPKYKQFPHPATAGARGRLIAAKEAWNTMPLPLVQAWRDYARTITKINSADGSAYSPIAYNAFCGLATRFLQANPSGTIPLNPPPDAFPGDEVVFSLTVIAGGVRITPSGANAEGVVTEILMQKLPNERRIPTKFYKSLLFHSFTTSPLDVPLEPGAYALAYRFVRTATGQAAEEVLLEIVVLGSGTVAGGSTTL